MAPLRILVVDDSVTIRQLISDALASDPAFEIAGVAPNGALALGMMARTRPDAVVLDLDMPVVNGIEFLEKVRPAWPRLPIVMFSTLTTHGAEATLQAMWAGASDYVPKPQTEGPEGALAYVRRELAPKLKALAAAAAVRDAAATHAPAPAPGRGATAKPVPAASPARAARTHAARLHLVAIGASTGGPRALAALLAGLPRTFELPVVIVQHMPPMFTRHLADGLASQCDIGVREAEHGQLLEPGVAWIAPGDHHLTLARDGTQVRLWLDQQPAENACRPSVNPLFRSAAQVYGAGVLGVILTGMGIDGLDGCTAVGAAGGVVLAQDEASSVVWGMPGAVTRAGLADRVLPLDDLAAEILALARFGGGRRAA